MGGGFICVLLLMIVRKVGGLAFQQDEPSLADVRPPTEAHGCRAVVIFCVGWVGFGLCIYPLVHLRWL